MQQTQYVRRWGYVIIGSARKIESTVKRKWVVSISPAPPSPPHQQHLSKLCFAFALLAKSAVRGEQSRGGTVFVCQAGVADRGVGVCVQGTLKGTVSTWFFVFGGGLGDGES